MEEPLRLQVGLIITNCHMSNLCEQTGINGEALQLHAVYKKPYFFLQVMQESVSVLSHMRICIITTSDARESVLGSKSHPAILNL